MAYKMKGSTFYGKGNQSPLKQKYPSRDKQKQINEKVKGNKDSAKHMISIDKGFPSSETFGPDRDFRTNTQIREKSKPMTSKVVERLLKEGFLPTKIADSFAIAKNDPTSKKKK